MKMNVWIHRLATRARKLAPIAAFALLCRADHALGHPTHQASQKPSSETRLLRLRHVHRQQELSVQLLDDQGRIRRHALGELRDFLACHKTGADHPIHWRLASILLSVSEHWPTKRIVVHSGYRDPSVSHHAKRSNHTRGRAIDIRIPGVPNRQLFAALRRSFDKIGLGYYPNSSFVHLDVRESSAIWVDYAGPGQSACYSRTPAKDLASGAADRLSIEQARQRGCR